MQKQKRNGWQRIEKLKRLVGKTLDPGCMRLQTVNIAIPGGITKEIAGKCTKMQIFLFMPKIAPLKYTKSQLIVQTILTPQRLSPPETVLSLLGLCLAVLAIFSFKR